jgi:DNA polymerase-3 subunit delta'
MVDLLSLYRDILLLQLGASTELINLAIFSQLTAAATASTAKETLATMDAIATARSRIERNVTPLLALEAMLIAARRPGGAR